MEPETLLIKNSQVVRSDRIEQADILIRGGKIERITSGLEAEGEAEVIDAQGLHCLPGVIDPQVHFRYPGQEWKEDWDHASRAAVAGGVTTVFDMPNNNPPVTDRAGMAAKKEHIAQHSRVNYNCFIGATPDNVEELNAVPNVCGIKIFMGSSTGTLLVDKIADLDRIFAEGSRLIAVHAEDNELIERNRRRYDGTTDFADHARIRSAKAALRATQRAAGLAKRYERRLHVLHVSTADEAEWLARYGEPYITAEVTPQHLTLYAPDAYTRLGARAQMNPPLRERRHAEALWRALEAGHIHCIATDHAPHTLAEKSLPYGQAPSGMPGVETALPVMLEMVARGRCRLTQVVRWMAENPARCYVAQGKGRLEPGYDADLTLVDLNLSRRVERSRLQTKCGWSPFDGWTLRGWPVHTVVLGKIAMRDGEIMDAVRGAEVRIGEQGGS